MKNSFHLMEGDLPEKKESIDQNILQAQSTIEFVSFILDSLLLIIMKYASFDLKMFICSP